MSYWIEGVLLSDEGLKREHNEDNYSFFGICREDVKQNKSFLERKKRLRREYLAVYDGMGGEDAGEIASFIAAKNLKGCSVKDVKTAGAQQIRKVNQMICDKFTNGRMGTTLVSLFLENDCAIYCNVGDSRGYFFRDGKLKLLTKDHSEGQRLVDGGFLSLEEAKKKKSWHQLTQHLGIYEDEFVIEPHYSEEVELLPDDLFLLCSDGLSDLFSDEEIEKILRTDLSLKDLGEALLRLALERGGKDNVTILLARVKEDWISNFFSKIWD